MTSENLNKKSLINMTSLLKKTKNQSIIFFQEKKVIWTKLYSGLLYGTYSNSRNHLSMPPCRNYVSALIHITLVHIVQQF